MRAIGALDVPTVIAIDSAMRPDFSKSGLMLGKDLFE